MKDRRQPETLRLSSLIPTLTCADISKSFDWYVEVLGCHPGERFENGEGQLVGASIKLGAVEIFLGQDDWAKGKEREKGAGVRFFLVTEQNIDSLAAGIKARGGVLDHEPEDREWGSRDFAVTDPDGFKLSISSPMSSEKS